MHRLTHAAHGPLRYRTMMGSIQLRSHHVLPVAGHQKTGHRAQRFRQRRRRATVQQAKRLMGARIHRHFRFQRIVAKAGINDAQMRHQRVLAGGIERI